MSDVIQPYARIVDLTTNEVIASTTHIIDWQITWNLDKVGSLSVTVPAGDPGDYDGTEGSDGFAQALLLAASDVTGRAPKPLLLEFSLGPYDEDVIAIDSRRLVRNPQRTLVSNQRTLTESGSDLGDVLGAYIIERATYTDLPLLAVLKGTPGSMVPVESNPPGMLPSGHHIPYLRGVLPTSADWAAAPGTEGWASGATDRLVITAVVDPAITNQPTNVDVNAASVLGVITTMANRLVGSQPEAGHLVLDTSDATINLANTTDWGLTRETVGPSLVMGHVGTDAFGIFLSDASPYLLEDASTILPEGTHVTVDDSQYTSSANFLGGKSKGGLPDGASITALCIINNAPPAQSATLDQADDCLPLVGVDVNNEAGGIFMTIGDGQMVALPHSPQTPAHALTFDAGSTGVRDANLYMGSNHGVYLTSHTGGIHIYPGETQWTFLEGMQGDVVRLQVQVDPDDSTHNVLFALVRNSGDRWNGLWTYTAAHAWQRHLQSIKVRDFVSTDFGTAWIIDEDGTAVYRFHLGDDSATPPSGFALPHGQAYALGRAITTGDSPQDSVWAFVDAGGTSDHYTPAYYKVGVAGDWSGDWYDANVDNTLRSGTDVSLHGYTVVGTGVWLDPGFTGPTPAAYLGTDQGLWWTAGPLGGDLAWKQADLGGLSNYPIKKVGQGEAQKILPDILNALQSAGDGKTNRLFACTDNDLLWSSSSGRWWGSLQGRQETTMGPFLTAAHLAATGHLPDNTIRSAGSLNSDNTSMTASPLGLDDSTHLYIDPAVLATGPYAIIPKGFYIERYLDGHLDFQYRIRAQGAHLPGQEMSHLSEVQTNTLVGALDASMGVVTVANRWLAQHSVPRTTITVSSVFTQLEASLRLLRPTHRCSLTGTIEVLDISSTGHAVTTQVIHFDGTEPLWCISHTIRRGPGGTALTETILSPHLLAEPLSESDLAAALADSIHNLKAFAGR